jgi:mono/diheme cytochrome c family protein
MVRSFAVVAALPLLAAALGSAAGGLPAPDPKPEPSRAEKGYKALTGTAFIPGFWRPNAIPTAWKQWGVKEKPADYDAAFRDRYGLHPAPYPNDGLPMGLRRADILAASGIGIDCMVCHGGSLLGTSYIGLGNSTLDIQALFEELGAASGLAVNLPFTFTNVRGTNEADGFGVYLLGFRDPDLKIREWKNLGLHDDTCADVPAWWLLKKKRTIYHTGATDSRSVRTLMQFMMHPLTPADAFPRAEPAFRDIQQYLLSLDPPKYPFAIDKAKAAKGEAVFADHCAKCHGTYGENWTYPNKVVPLDEIGTDPKRHAGVEVTYGIEYSNSWFGKEPAGWFVRGKELRWTPGYQAPPLDGIWATAPYFHNGSVPTLDGVLNSKARPKLYTRTFKTDEADYDKDKVGWKVTELREPPTETLPPIERRKVYDTTQPGRSNAGHTYGDVLTDEERAAVIEYLKTL